MRIVILFILLITSFNIVFAQDIITMKNGEDIKAKVLEVTQLELKYKRFESLDGPTYTISKSDVLIVRYKDGTKDIFSNNLSQKTNEKNEIEIKKTITSTNDSQSNTERLKKGKKVFISCTNTAGKIHAENIFRKWDYWHLADKEEDADIIANIIIESKGLSYVCYISITNPVTKETIIKTKHTICYASEELNPKLAAIQKNIKEKLQPVIMKGN